MGSLLARVARGYTRLVDVEELPHDSLRNKQLKACSRFFKVLLLSFALSGLLLLGMSSLSEMSARETHGEDLGIRRPKRGENTGVVDDDTGGDLELARSTPVDGYPMSSGEQSQANKDEVKIEDKIIDKVNSAGDSDGTEGGKTAVSGDEGEATSSPHEEEDEEGDDEPPPVVRGGMFAPDAKSCSRANIKTLLDAANCGSGYDVMEARQRNHRRVHVVLQGEGWTKNILKLSGCPIGEAPCPNNPKCEFTVMRHSTSPGPSDADVVVMLPYDAANVNRAAPRKPRGGGNRTHPYRVLYWREALWPAVTKEVQKHFDFTMGIHYGHVQILNPSWLSTPYAMLHSFPEIPTSQKKKFAIALISDCHTRSRREVYLEHLLDYLGADRVNLYGDCYQKFPRNEDALKTIFQYKFFLSFENTIQNGYVTEKLFFQMGMPPVPVYYGTEYVPNITLTPSYIRVADFKSPKELARHLLFLDEHPEEYEKYHAWRRDPGRLLDPKFLDYVAYHLPGPREWREIKRVYPDYQFVWRNRGLKQPPYRRAACCRLCDEEVLRRSAEDFKTRPRYIGNVWEEDRIRRRYFGDGWARPGKKAFLKSSHLAKRDDEETSGDDAAVVEAEEPST